MESYSWGCECTGTASLSCPQALSCPRLYGFAGRRTESHQPRSCTSWQLEASGKARCMWVALRAQLRHAASSHIFPGSFSHVIPTGWYRMTLLSVAHHLPSHKRFLSPPQFLVLFFTEFIYSQFRHVILNSDFSHCILKMLLYVIRIILGLLRRVSRLGFPQVLHFSKA